MSQGLKIEMENKKEKRVFTKTILLCSDDDGNFVGRVCKTMGYAYYAVKVGMTTHMCLTNDPVPSAFVITIQREGGYRIMDREDSIYVMVSKEGVEVAQGKWPRYQFETIDSYSTLCNLTVKGQEVRAEIKLGTGVGSVKPYTDAVDVRRNEGLVLPGIEFLTVDGDMREARVKLREERAQRNEIILSALRDSNADRGIARFMGLRGDQIASMNVGSSRMESRVPRLSWVTESDGLGKGVCVTTFVYSHSSPNATTYRHVVCKSNIIEPQVTPIKQKIEMSFSEPPAQTTSIPDVSEYQMGEEYARLIAALESHPDIKSSSESVSFRDPQRVASYENTMFEMRVNLKNVPLYILDQPRSEYRYVKNGDASRVTVVLQNGYLVALPEA
uniref:Non-structural protein NS2 n=1 Tax=Skunk River virus TaxID=2488682 RepID=A0A3S8RBV6_9REOV|nr:NS2 [Skunk River virus]